jgi:hypothetical protein
MVVFFDPKHSNIANGLAEPRMELLHFLNRENTVYGPAKTKTPALNRAGAFRAARSAENVEDQCDQDVIGSL